MEEEGIDEYYRYSNDEEQEQEQEQEQEEQEEEKPEQEYKPQPIKIPVIDYSKMFKEIKKLNNIKTYITYINTDNEIEIIKQKKIYLTNNDNIVTRKQLIDVIKNYQRNHNVKYKLISIMVYNIHVSPESLPSYIENPSEFISLYTLNRIESFELQPTLRLLKNYNAIYFFFFECPETNNDRSSLLSVPTTSHFINNNKNNTRRIQIRGLQKQKHKKTKRYDRYVNLL
jgi:hypothetical protein